MFDIVKWVAWMSIATFCLLLLRALFRKPVGTSHQKRWAAMTTPELFECAFKSERMFGIAERTARRHIDQHGPQVLLDFYGELFNELKKGVTSDGYRVRGYIEDAGEDRVRLMIFLDHDSNRLERVYEVTYIHLSRVTDALSPALLGRLDWHKPTTNDQG